MVGVWEAQVLQLPDPEQPDQMVDLIPQGASYTLSILATGQFTAVFDLILAQGYEAGRVEVSGNQVALTPTSPPGTGLSGTWQIQDGRLVVDAIRSLDLDGDGSPEVIPFFVELVEREL
jgi:hypothetical protein